jgi:predicted nuclease of predicted toxin-antitoxin system
VRLLFDQNLPHRFVTALADLFPNSEHVKSAGLAVATDRQVWDYARQRGLAIMSKDADFHQMSFLYGAPPKTVWLRCGNCSTADLERIIREHTDEIAAFLQDTTGALLVIG